MEQNENTLSVLKIAPGQYPQQVEIDNDLKALQQAVGGSIDAVYPFADPVAIICHDEGKLMGLPLNRALRDENGQISENFKIKKRRKASEDELIIFRNTHEPIITQEVWDAAQKLRKRSPRKLQNGTYSHRLSGLIFCADCGHRMSYKSPDSVRRPDNRHFDSDSGFQCVRYRNRYDGCTSHSIKVSVLEEAILKSIQAVSDYVLEDEDAFIEELQAQWQSQKQGLSAENKKDLANAKKRMDELDNLIRGLYESNLSGKLPDRQFQRLMAQYDEEQEQCENRIKELEAKAGDSMTSKVDPKRFVALVRKYQDCEVLTDDMLYAFIEKVEVHAPTGGRTRYRQQRIF